MPLDPKTADLMLTDFGAWENTLDDTQRQNLENTFRFEPDRVAAQKRFASVAHVAAYTGRDVEEVSNRFEDYYMHAYARDEEKGLGIVSGVKDANEFYGLLTKRASDNKTKAETLKSASSAAFDSALRGGSGMSDFAAWQVENEHLPEAFGGAFKVWEKTRADVEKELGPDGRAAASRAFRAMRSITGASQESDALINEAKQDLINLRVRSPKAYKLALAAVQLMAADSGKVEKGVGQGMAENAGRVISDIGASFMFARPLVEMSEDASEALVKAGITNAENPERLAAQIRARREVESDIRDMSRGVIDPVKTEREGWTGWAESAAYMGASSLPYMVSVMIPGGTTAAAGSFTSDSYDEFRSNGWEGPSAAAGAVASGVFQAAVEKASEFITKIPGVAGVFNKFGVKPGSSWATQFLIRAGMRSGVEVGEEVIQEATTPFIQELAHAIAPSIPDTPEGKHLSDVMGRFFEADNFAPLLLSVLPLGLVGAAMSTSQDMDLMEDAKLFFGDDAAAQIMAESDPDKRDAMIRDKFKALPAGEFIKRARQGMESAMDRMKARFQDQESIKALQDASSPEYTVNVTRSPSGWQVRTGDGNVVTVDSAEAARRIAVDLRQVGSQQEADALVNVIDDYYAAGRQAETVLTGETVKASRKGGVSGVRLDEKGVPIAGTERPFNAQALETIRQEAEAAGFASGTSDIFAYVNGGNEIFPMRVADTAKGVARVLNLYKSQEEGQPQVITFLHENIESSWRLGMANGTFSEQETRTAMRALLPAFEASKPANSEEGQFIENLRTLADGKGNETMLRETVSEMVIRDVLGRDRQGRATGMRPGSISRAIEAAVMGAKTQAEASAFRRILAMFRAFSAYLKGVFGTVKAIVKARDEGKIGEEWDTFVNKVLGIDEVKQMEQAAVEEAQEIMDAGNMAFSVSKGYLGTVANGEVIAVKVTDLSKAQHADFREIATEDDAKDFRFNPTDSTVYWWNPAKVSDEDRQKVADHLEALGQTVNAQKGIKASSANYAAAHGTFSISRVTPAQDARQKAFDAFREARRDAEDALDTDRAKVRAGVEIYQETGDSFWTAIYRGRYNGVDYDQSGGFTIWLDDKSRWISKGDDGFDSMPVDHDSFAAASDWVKQQFVEDWENQQVDRTFGQFERGKDEAFNMLDTFIAPPDIESRQRKPWEGSGGLGPSGSIYGEFALIGNEDVVWKLRIADHKNTSRQHRQPDEQFIVSKTWTPESVEAAMQQAYDWLSKQKKPSILRNPPAPEGGPAASQEASQPEADEAVTRDESGNVIPLSQRFNESSPDIRFSISPIRNLNELSDQVERQFKENPAGALEVKSKVIRQFAKLRDKWSTERWTPRGDKIRPISEKRTVKSLDKEQAMRQAQRESELVDEGMMKLPPATLMAWSEGVGTLEDHPFVKHMLNNHGRLMSESTAERMGKLKTDGKGNAGDYNDAGWIPPNWYNGGPSFKTVVVTFKDGGKTVFDIGKIPADIQKQIDSGNATSAIKTTRLPSTGGIMPNEMAQAMYDDGLLKTGALAPDLWAELDSIVKSHRSAKEGYAKAENAVRDVEKKALEQATKEAQAWRDEANKMQNEDWSPRESLVRDLITLEAIVAMFPQEIRGKIGGFVTLARKASESARLKVLQKQLERGQRLLEKHLKEQYGTAVDKLLERYQSKRDSSGRISGKILSTATEQVDYAAEFLELSESEQEERQDALEMRIEKAETAEDAQDALTKLGIARLFEVWDTKDSASRESAFTWLNETIEAGKQGKKLLDEERKAFLDDMRQSGQESILAGDELNAAVADNLTNFNKKVMRRALLGMRGVLSESLWTTLQRLELIFGEDSKILDYFAGKIINAANLSTDIKRLVESQKKDALTVIFNSDSKFAHARGIAELQKIKDSGVVISRVTKEKVTLDIDTLTKLADGTMSANTAGLEQVEVEAALEEFASNARKSTVTIEKVTSRAAPTSRQMSETQGIQWWLWSMQDASRKQMERDGWDADSFEQLEKFLSPEAKALGRWIAGSYQDAAGMIDPIYRRLFNAPLPRIKNYSPIHRRNMNAGGEVMDMESSDMNSGLAAGFTKSRVNTTASLVESDALAVFLAHWENVSHWVAHAELMRDMKAVLLDKDTAVAIRQKKSEGYLQRLKQDISTIEKNGTNNASELVNMSRFWRWLMQYRAYKGLAFRLSPIIKQTPALLNPLLADVPAHNYMMGMARAFVEPQTFAREVSAMWKSDIIRRRIESGFSAESRIAIQGSSMTGSQAILAMQTGMMPMAAVDGGWTALGAAISFDYYRRGYIGQGMNTEMADNAATARVEKMIATSAQPADVYARALYERNGNPFMRSMSMFVSDQRKALAIELMAIRRLATGKSKNKMLDVQRALVAHVVQAGVSQVMAVVIASLLGDDEDRDRELSREQWTLALTLGPINGLFVFGRLIDKLGRGLLGLRVFPADDLASKAANDLLKGGKNMDELFSPDNPEEFMDVLDSLSTAAAAGMSAAIGPAGGAADVGANLIREFRKIQDRLSE